MNINSNLGLKKKMMSNLLDPPIKSEEDYERWMRIEKIQNQTVEKQFSFGFDQRIQAVFSAILNNLRT